MDITSEKKKISVVNVCPPFTLILKHLKFYVLDMIQVKNNGVLLIFWFEPESVCKKVLGISPRTQHST